MLEIIRNLFLGNFHQVALTAALLIFCVIGIIGVIMRRADQPYPVRIGIGIVFFGLGFPTFCAGMVCSLALRTLSTLFRYKEPDKRITGRIQKTFAAAKRFIFDQLGRLLATPGWLLTAEALDLFKRELPKRRW